MEIVLSTSGVVLTGSDRGVPVELSPEERKFVEIALKQFSQNEQLRSGILIDQRSSNYKTVSYGVDYDFLRFKIGSRAKWFSVLPNPADKNDPRFDGVSNKRQLHWKISLSDVADVGQYSDLISNAALCAMEQYKLVEK